MLVTRVLLSSSCRFCCGAVVCPLVQLNLMTADWLLLARSYKHIREIREDLCMVDRPILMCSRIIWGKAQQDTPPASLALFFPLKTAQGKLKMPLNSHAGFNLE